ncbi:type-2 angiotensin II receptor-like [Babylonia areolata]|uniref:type-2 angiotensin II receptor-like n=1 Tax=Babylonia areolata TaxID=304850 RepID=UPI003FD50297
MTNVTEDNHGMGNTNSFTTSADRVIFPELQAAIILWKVWPPCVLLLGGFGNVATIFVMVRMKDHNSSQQAILIALAASDLVLLYTGALRHGVYNFFGVELRDLHTVTCKVLIWMIYSSGTASAWLLTCVTVQRTLAIKWPHKIKIMCSLKRTWVVVVNVICIACAIQFHWVIGMDVAKHNHCTCVLAGYEEFTVVWRWVDMCISSLIPAMCLAVCDIVLSTALFKATSTASVSVQAVANSSTQQNVTNRRKTASRTTVMILALSSTFLVLTLPVCVYLVWEHYAEVFKEETSRLYAKGKLVYAVTFFLWYTNSAVNFLLYCFTGTRFRREFLSWIRCGRHDDSATLGGKRAHLKCEAVDSLKCLKLLTASSVELLTASSVELLTASSVELLTASSVEQWMETEDDVMTFQHMTSVLVTVMVKST